MEPYMHKPTERIVWASYPSWLQFSWLYLISGIVAWRAALFWESIVRLP
jgi:hypothetical protein